VYRGLSYQSEKGARCFSLSLFSLFPKRRLSEGEGPLPSASQLRPRLYFFEKEVIMGPSKDPSFYFHLAAIVPTPEGRLLWQIRLFFPAFYTP